MKNAKGLYLSTVFLLIVGAGCTLYQSSDREEFNSQGHLYKPKTKSATPESHECFTATANPADAETISIHPAEDAYEVVIYKQVTEESAAYCRLLFRGSFTENELKGAAQNHIETFVSQYSGL